jgi:hypothetical protein
MNLLKQGLSDKELGQRMHIETCTVNGFLKRIFPKLGMHTRRRAVQMLFGAGPQTCWACSLILVPYIPSPFLLTPRLLRCQIGSSLWCIRIQPMPMRKRPPFLSVRAIREVLELDQDEAH